MCEEWWDERLLKEQAEKLKRSSPLAPAPKREEQEKPERKPQKQPEPVPV
jgi:hypothetical protein